MEDNGGWTPLVYALVYGHVRVVHALESDGARLVHFRSQAGMPPGATPTLGVLQSKRR